MKLKLLRLNTSKKGKYFGNEEAANEDIWRMLDAKYPVIDWNENKDGWKQAIKRSEWQAPEQRTRKRTTDVLK